MRKYWFTINIQLPFPKGGQCIYDGVCVKEWSEKQCSACGLEKKINYFHFRDKAAAILLNICFARKT